MSKGIYETLENPFCKPSRTLGFGRVFSVLSGHAEIPRELKFSAVFHLEKRSRSAKLQLDLLPSPYFTRCSVNFPICSYLRIHTCYLLQIWIEILSIGKKTTYIVLGFIIWLVCVLESSLSKIHIIDRKIHASYEVKSKWWQSVTFFMRYVWLKFEVNNTFSSQKIGILRNL